MGKLEGNHRRLATALERLARAFALVKPDAPMGLMTDEETGRFCDAAVRHIADACYGYEPVITNDECELFERLALRFEEVAAARAAGVPDQVEPSMERMH